MSNAFKLSSLRQRDGTTRSYNGAIELKSRSEGQSASQFHANARIPHQCRECRPLHNRALAPLLFDRL